MFASFEWTALYLVLAIWGGAVHCQNCAGTPHHNERASRESGCSNASSKSQLMSTLLTIAAANGVLPDLLPVIQPALSNELPAEIPKTLNLIQLNQHQRLQEPVVMAAKPMTTINQTPVALAPYPTYNMPVLQTTFTPGPSQGFRLETTPAGYPGATAQPSKGTVPPMPAIWQPQATANRAPELWQPIVHEMLPENRTPANFQMTPPSAYLENGNAIEEQISRLRFPLIDGNDGMPVNLQINLPSQNSPPPHITVVSAPPAQQAIKESMAAQSRYPPLHPPIVVDRSDSLDHILPIMLIALIANERDNCGCNCCCPCSSSKSIIPIPYPIPFPINSPIIDGSNRSSKNETRDGTNDEDHREKK